MFQVQVQVQVQHFKEPQVQVQVHCDKLQVQVHSSFYNNCFKFLFSSLEIEKEKFK